MLTHFGEVIVTDWIMIFIAGVIVGIALALLWHAFKGEKKQGPTRGA